MTSSTRALYVSNGEPTITAPGELTYEYSDGGVTVRKTFRFDDSYVLHVEVAVTQNGKTIEALPVWPAGIRRSGRPALPTPLRVWSTRPKARSPVWRPRRSAEATPFQGR